MPINQIRSKSHRRRVFADDMLERMLSVDPVPPILLHPMEEASGGVAFDASPEGNDGVYNGGVRYGQPGLPGERRTSVLFAEATTNLITNPSFETNTTGWLTAGANTIAQSLDVAKEGSKSLKVTYQDNNSVAYYTITINDAAHVFSFEVWIPSDWDGTALLCSASVFAGATITELIAVDLSKRDQWQRLSTQIIPDTGDLTGNLLISVFGGAPSAGKHFYIDATQMEEKAYATPPCDGSMGTGFSWSGDAHASTSSRAVTVNNFHSADFAADFNGLEGTVVVPIKAYNDGVWTDGVERRFFSIASDDNSYVLMRKSTADRQLDLYYKAGGVTELRSVVGVSSIELFMIALTWSKSDNQVFMYINAVQEGPVHAPIGTWAGTLLATQSVFGAANSSGTLPFNGWGSYLGLWPKALSQPQLASMLPGA